MLMKTASQTLTEQLCNRFAERIRTRLDAARARSVKLVLAHGCSFAAEPAGLFGWVDTGVDTERLAERLREPERQLDGGRTLHRGQHRLVHAADLVDRLVDLDHPHLECRQVRLALGGDLLRLAAFLVGSGIKAQRRALVFSKDAGRSSNERSHFNNR